jgi:hypothetical protein
MLHIQSPNTQGMENEHIKGHRSKKTLAQPNQRIKKQMPVG